MFGLTLCFLSHRQYRDHVKDLSCLSKDLSRTVIVDNNPFSFLLQPLNGIPCIPFSAGQPHDGQVPYLHHSNSTISFCTSLNSAPDKTFH